MFLFLLLCLTLANNNDINNPMSTFKGDEGRLKLTN